MMIDSKKYRNFSIKEIKDGIQKKEFEIKDVLKACLQCICSYEDKINAWEEHINDFNESEIITSNCKDLDLIGVPFGTKDIINTLKFKTQMGSQIWKNHRAGNNARIVSRLINNGAILVGKTVTSEFAVDSKNKTKNPWDLSKLPGTSSSGSAASVSCGMVPFAIGTQTLGSIIRPASWCGIYGMKPSYGLLPRTGILKTTDTLDTVGFFSRSVYDMFILLKNNILRDLNHPTIYNQVAVQSVNKKKFKIGFLKKKSSKIDHKFDQFLKKISLSSNICIKEIKLPKWYEESLKIHEELYNSGLFYYFKDEINNHKNELSDEFLKRVNKVKYYDPKNYKYLLHKQQELHTKIELFFDSLDIDFILCLSSNESAPKVESQFQDDYNFLWTLLWLPVLNLPHLCDEYKMPVGISIVGKRYSDFKILNFVRLLIKEQFVSIKCKIP